MKAEGIRFVPARALARSGVETAVALARKRLAGLSRVYLTVDIDVADLRAKAVTHRERLAALMVTYPSTHGVFEET